MSAPAQSDNAARVGRDAWQDPHALTHDFYQEGLTGVRALAALWVAIYHMNVLVGPVVIPVHLFAWTFNIHPLITLGWTGVNIFYVLSGFLLTTHLLASLARRTPEEVLPRYFLARAKRVFPAFWAQMAILFAIALAVDHAIPYWSAYVPMHIFMMHNMSEGASSAINRVYWTLPVELGYYVLLPLVALAIARAERRGGARRWRLLAILYGAALAAAITYRHIVYPWNPASINWISNQLPGCIDQFMLGTVTAAGLRWWRQDHGGLRGPSEDKVSTVLALAAVAGMVAMIYYVDSLYAVFWQHWAVYWSYSINAVLIAALILAIALGGPLTRVIFENRVAVFLGTVSYSIYLWHFPVGTWIADNVDMKAMTIAPFLAITLPAIVAVSTASYFLFERPFLRR